MKKVFTTQPETVFSFLMGTIGTDNVDNYIRALIERDMERSDHGNKK